MSIAFWIGCSLFAYLLDSLLFKEISADLFTLDFFHEVDR